MFNQRTGQSSIAGCFLDTYFCSGFKYFLFVLLAVKQWSINSGLHQEELIGRRSPRHLNIFSNSLLLYIRHRKLCIVDMLAPPM